MTSFFQDDDLVSAYRIVERLLSGEEAAVELPYDVIVSDIEQDGNAFTRELAFLRFLEVDVPVVDVGDVGRIPVSVTVAISPSFRSTLELGAWRAFPAWRRSPDELFPGYETITEERALAAFVEHASLSLASRIRALRDLREQRRWPALAPLRLRQRAGGTVLSLAPGCNFTVSTDSSGLRVFWSGAYFVSPNYFSHPTTPTSSVLQAGRYVFGVDGGAYGNEIHWDTNAVVTLPGQPSVHLNF